MLNIKNGSCNIKGTVKEITNDYKCLLKAIKYTVLLDILKEVIGEELENAENDPGN